MVDAGARAGTGSPGNTWVSVSIGTDRSTMRMDQAYRVDGVPGAGSDNRLVITVVVLVALALAAWIYLALGHGRFWSTAVRLPTVTGRTSAGAVARCDGDRAGARRGRHLAHDAAQPARAGLSGPVPGGGRGRRQFRPYGRRCSPHRRARGARGRAAAGLGGQGRRHGGRCPLGRDARVPALHRRRRALPHWCAHRSRHGST